MEQFERLKYVLNRVQTYPIHVVLIELTVISIVVYLIFRFLRGTRGARVIKGVTLIFIVAVLSLTVLGPEHQFNRLTFLFDKFMLVASFALIVVFQPELRRGLVRLGEARLFRTGGLRKARVIEEILSSVGYLSKNKIGALIAIEGQVGLRGVVEAGTPLDAAVTRELLNTIFWPGSALHDMGVVIRGDRLVAAGVQFPLAEGEQFSSELGSRHRAAVGLSQETDALIIVVSEETGTISVAERGQLKRNLTIDGLRTHLVRGLGQVQLPPETNDSGREENEAV